jgi:hypothetical protein
MFSLFALVLTHGASPVATEWNGIQLPIFVVGMPKSGTTSIAAYFRCIGLTVSHEYCHKPNNAKIMCGSCIQQNIKDGFPALHECGRYEVFTQLDANRPETNECYYPQRSALSAISKAYPRATFVLNLRPVEQWVQSVNHWSNLRQRLANCSMRGFPNGVSRGDKGLRTLYESQTDIVRSFVKTHQSHKLVEVEIENPNIGNFLCAAFNISFNSCWGKRNSGNYHPHIAARLNIKITKSTDHAP